jgi:Amino acid synthesis
VTASSTGESRANPISWIMWDDRANQRTIVGVAGEMEHGGAGVHPMFDKPIRAAIGGGKAVIGSNVKVAAAGTSLDVPLGHKDDSW